MMGEGIHPKSVPINSIPRIISLSRCLGQRDNWEMFRRVRLHVPYLDYCRWTVEEFLVNEYNLRGTEGKDMQKSVDSPAATETFADIDRRNNN